LKLVFAVDHSVNNFRGDQLLFASRKAALDLVNAARVAASSAVRSGAHTPRRE